MPKTPLSERSTTRATLVLLGPAFVAAIAYVDPGNVAANLTAGARYGYLLLWVLVLANLIAVLVQYQSAKVGLVTGQSLPEILGERLPTWGRRIYWLQAELVAAATDIAEVLGGAIALYLLGIGFKGDRVVRDRMIALVLLLVCNVAFWASFEQAGNSLNFFAQNHIRDLSLGSWVMPFEWFQSVNAIFIVALGPVFASLWVILDRSNLNPSIPLKFGLALVQVGLGFGLIMLGIGGADANAEVPWYFLTGLYLIHTTAELCISPVGLSMVTKLAPSHMTGMVMGAWFVSIALANYGAGLFSKIAGEANVSAAGGAAALDGYIAAFTPILWMTIILGLLLSLASPLVNKLMHGVK